MRRSFVSPSFHIINWQKHTRSDWRCCEIQLLSKTLGILPVPRVHYKVSYSIRNKCSSYSNTHNENTGHVPIKVATHLSYDELHAPFSYLLTRCYEIVLQTLYIHPWGVCVCTGAMCLQSGWPNRMTATLSLNGSMCVPPDRGSTWLNNSCRASNTGMYTLPLFPSASTPHSAL